jgi:hypothetical protein
VAAYDTKTRTFDTKLETYNQHLAALDDEQNEVDAAEKELRDWNRRMLSASEAYYGGDSSEYEAVGGTRTSERKKSKRKGSGGSTPKRSASVPHPSPFGNFPLPIGRGARGEGAELSANNRLSRGDEDERGIFVAKSQRGSCCSLLTAYCPLHKKSLRLTKSNLRCARNYG